MLEAEKKKKTKEGKLYKKENLKKIPLKWLEANKSRNVGIPGKKDKKSQLQKDSPI